MDPLTAGAEPLRRLRRDAGRHGVTNCSGTPNSSAPSCTPMPTTATTTSPGTRTSAPFATTQPRSAQRSRASSDVPVRLPPLDQDPPLHKNYRQILNKYFAPAYLKRYEDDMRGQSHPR